MSNTHYDKNEVENNLDNLDNGVVDVVEAGRKVSRSELTRSEHAPDTPAIVKANRLAFEELLAVI